ncbi:MAG: hypothetical protein ACR2J4_02460 [Deinococcus sp.]
MIAWTFFEGDSRLAFQAALPLSSAAWARGRGWAVWKALLVLEQSYRTDPANAEEARRVLSEVLADGHAES